jgi:rhodanese-related sulfurtransferase
MIWRLAGLALLPWSALQAAPTALDQRIEELVLAIESRVADVPVVLAPQLLQELSGAQPPLLLDVRDADERAVSVIPGALSELGSIAPGTRVVVYCTVGLRSGISARELRTRGIDAVNLRGGILAWLAAGGTLVDPAGNPTRRVHVYGRRWNAVPEDVEAIW